jgi:pSer/pThr/pTyr-binding forkhead associated (FHA) protein
MSAREPARPPGPQFRPPPARAWLIGLTPESRAALGPGEAELTQLPFRVGRESRGLRRAVTRVIMERRKPGSTPNNDLYLLEEHEPFNVSREHFLIDHNGTDFVLVDRQSTCGTIVEGALVGGNHDGGAVTLRDGDVIVVGTSASRFVFKFRTR